MMTETEGRADLVSALERLAQTLPGGWSRDVVERALERAGFRYEVTHGSQPIRGWATETEGER